MVEKTLEAI